MSVADIYQKDLLKLAARATGAGRLDNPDGSVRIHNPYCGDRITVDVKLDGDRVAEIGHEAKACMLCQASASILGKQAPGRTVDELQDLETTVEAMLKQDGTAPDGDWADYASFDPVREVQSRHECVMLPFRALLKAARDADA